MVNYHDTWMKDYRIDVFRNREHYIHYFDTETEATRFGAEQAKTGLVFLLKHFFDDRYEIVREIKQEEN